METKKSRINIEMESFILLSFLILTQEALKIRGNICSTDYNATILIVFTSCLYYNLRRKMKLPISSIKNKFMGDTVGIVIITILLVVLFFNGITLKTEQGEIGRSLVLSVLCIEAWLIYLVELIRLKNDKRG